MLRRCLSLMSLFLTLTLLTGCGAATSPSTTSAAESTGETRLRVVATLFPQYDFARAIAGDRADVTLLLPPGAESHTFEPTPADMAGIEQCNLFLYTGKDLEPWAARLTAGELPSTVRVIDLSKSVELTGEPQTHDHQTDHAFDPHIWTSPANAIQMTESIKQAFIELDPTGAEQYRKNAAAYCAELQALDDELFDIVRTGARDELAFGGRFAFHYLTERYGLRYRAAFDSCSAETEPSARAVAEIIDEIKREKIPVIYYEEMSDPKVARMIAQETGAKPLMLHSCHNRSKEEAEAGASYLSLMRQNAANIKEGLA